MSSTKKKYTRMERVLEFNHEVLGIKPSLVANIPDTHTALLTATQLHEEANEFEAAARSDDIVGMTDALIDSLYFAYGALYKMGITEVMLDAMFEAVHSANMTKKKGVKAGREGFDAADAVKSDGWVPPEVVIMRILKSRQRNA